MGDFLTSIFTGWTPTDIIATLFSAVALILSYKAFMRDSPESELDRTQENKRKELVYRTLVLSDQIQTMARAQTEGIIPDPYLANSMKVHAQRLEDSLDEAIELELLSDLLEEENPEHGITLFAAFLQSLQELRENTQNEPADWTKIHLITGMTRLHLICNKFEYLKNMKKESHIAQAWAMQGNFLSRLTELLGGTTGYIKSETFHANELAETV